ncbi:Polycomb group RING finger protein 3 [Echinococcus granulosus]|nr:Polycomb group RING finger protein 3 [Echinococcus granulosus]
MFSCARVESGCPCDLMQEMSINEHIDLAYLNPHLICNICHVCKSCIVKYLSTNNTCPVCDITIHQSHPLNYISADRTLQDIVYKIVPNLKEDFYRFIGQSPPPSEDLIYEHKTLSVNHVTDGSAKSIPNSESPADPNFHRNDEQVHVRLEPGSATLKPLSLKYLRISSKATVTHLRKYIAQQVLNDMSKFNEIDIFISNCEKGTFLGRDHVLKFVQVVYWNDDRPMPLEYRLSTKFL